MFCCPICGGTLEKEGRSCFCEKRHCYDLAKEGYVNLLPVTKKHSQDPGDTREMVLSRRSFLEAGYYEPFRKMARTLVEECSGEGDVILDAGCGEGYYTRHMARGRESYGFDISRNAIRLAAKRDPNTLYAVAGSYDIPFKAGAVQFLSTLFSPIAEGEFRRVLKDGGYWMLVVPTERHLYGLKEMLYDQPYENVYQETRYEGFTQVDRRRVEGSIILEDPTMIQALFTMTPYYWKSSKESSERAKCARRLETEIGFDFILYQKNKT